MEYINLEEKEWNNPRKYIIEEMKTCSKYCVGGMILCEILLFICGCVSSFKLLSLGLCAGFAVWFGHMWCKNIGNERESLKEEYLEQYYKEGISLYNRENSNAKCDYSSCSLDKAYFEAYETFFKNKLTMSLATIAVVLSFAMAVFSLMKQADDANVWYVILLFTVIGFLILPIFFDPLIMAKNKMVKLGYADAERFDKANVTKLETELSKLEKKQVDLTVELLKLQHQMQEYETKQTRDAFCKKRKKRG